MLSYPDRQRFEQLRSRWEAVQPTTNATPTMVGRKEKSSTQQPLIIDNGPSRFRRKLSSGFSLISNPLSQRKTTPVRQPTDGFSLRRNGYNINFEECMPQEPQSLPSPPHQSPSTINDSLRQNDTAFGSNAGQVPSLDGDRTSKQLPRSRTMSFIPRPSRTGSMSSVAESQSPPKPRHPTSLPQQETHSTPSKIPTPSPPSSRQRSSPRLYNQCLTTQQAKLVAAENAFASVSVRSPPEVSVRSYTTPNLTKSGQSPRPTRFMASRNSMPQKSSGFAPGRKRDMKENATPTNQRYSNRLTQTEEKSPIAESPAASAVTISGRPIGAGNVLVQTKQNNPATPTTATKRRSSQFVPQTPLSAQKAFPKKCSPTDPSTSLRTSISGAIAQPRLMGPINPPTPPTIDQGAIRLALSQIRTDRKMRRRTFTTPSRQSSASRLSGFQIGTNNEVRPPRSSPPQPLLRHSEPPPMPSIPEKYKSFSMPILSGKEHIVSERSHWTEDIPHTRDQTGGEISTPSEVQSAIRTHERKRKARAKEESGHSDNYVKATPSAKETADNNARSRIYTPHSLLSTPSISFTSLSELLRVDLFHQRHNDSADTSNSQQVKDYMPAQYWAGRFQTRFDQWRTEAMQVELGPNYKAPGPLGQCRLNDEKIVVCQIFVQLRDLCMSHQAADSLWVSHLCFLSFGCLTSGFKEFEYKYKQEHKMLNAAIDLPPTAIRKLDEATPRRGPIGRAVRKLTPRKSSFVNLLKGKGWNREDIKTTEGTTDRNVSYTTNHDSYSSD